MEISFHFPHNQEKGSVGPPRQPTTGPCRWLDATTVSHPQNRRVGWLTALRTKERLLLCWNQPTFPRFELKGFRIHHPKIQHLKGLTEYFKLKKSEKQQVQEEVSDLTPRLSVRGALPTPGRKDYPYLQRTSISKRNLKEQALCFPS